MAELDTSSLSENAKGSENALAEEAAGAGTGEEESSHSNPVKGGQEGDSNDAADDDDDDDDDDLFGTGTDDSTTLSEPAGTVDKVSTNTPEAQVPTVSSPRAGSIPRKGSANGNSNGSPNGEISSPVSPKATVTSTTSTKSTATTSTSAAAPTVLRAGNKYGLPEGVKIPASVDTASLLQGRLLDTLKSLPVNLINDALTEYDDAVHTKGDSIRNRGGYLFGVLKRYGSVHDRAVSGEGEGILPMGEGLTPAVNERLEHLVTSSFCGREEMNDKVKSKIRMLSEKDAFFAIAELEGTNRSQIRNFGSFFMGILNRYMRGDASSYAQQQQQQQQSGRSSSGTVGSAAHPPNQYQQQQQRPDSFSSRGGRGGGGFGNDRGRDRFHRDNNNNNNSFRQQDSYASNQRERSRDRFEDRRNDPYSPPPPPQQRDHRGGGSGPPVGYDSRQQQQHSWQLPPPPSSHTGGYNSNKMGGGGPPPPMNQQNRTMNSMPPQQGYQPPPTQQQQYMQSNQQQHQQQPMHQQPPPSNQQEQYTSQGYPPNSQGDMQPQMGGPPGNMQPQMGGPPGNMQPQMGGPPGNMQPQMGHAPNNPNMYQPQQHPQQQQQQPPSMGNQQPYMGNQQNQNQNQFVQPQFMGNQQQPGMGGPPPSIQNQNQYQQPLQGNMPGSYPPTPGGWQQQHQQQPSHHPSQGQMPFDILGLADKAASAVQALASQNKMLMPSGPPSYSAPQAPLPGPHYSNYNSAPMGAPPPREQGYNNNMNAPYPNGPPPGQYHQGQPDHRQRQPDHRQGQPDHRQGQPDHRQGQPERRRRTKATISELSIPVQVAVMVSLPRRVLHQLCARSKELCPCLILITFSCSRMSNPRSMSISHSTKECLA
jgi:hypothetical protein